ncbi:hypothetical protein FOA52_016046 [Chlamydomonas sp. UWO 241]|nr:hypothetical protein FOA52_016046 [Chlamydomonas sp. UWO 241]
MAGPAYYLDDKFSIIDEVLKARNDAAVMPVSDLADGLSTMAAQYWGNRPLSHDIARCALGWLDVWAVGKGLTGIANSQGRNTIKFRLTQIALSYLRMRDDPTLDPVVRARVGVWLARVGRTHVQDYYVALFDRPGELVASNHVYWAGACLAAVGIAADDVPLFFYSVSLYPYFLRTVLPNGTLPAEIIRGSRALLYHAFAASALVTMDLLARPNGINLYATRAPGTPGFALPRLIDLVIRGYDDPSLLAADAGEPQLPLPSSNCDGHCDLALLEIYARLCTPGDGVCERASGLARQLRPLSRQLLGGYTSYFYGPQIDLVPPPPPAPPPLPPAPSPPYRPYLFSPPPRRRHPRRSLLATTSTATPARLTATATTTTAAAVAPIAAALATPGKPAARATPTPTRAPPTTAAAPTTTVRIAPALIAAAIAHTATRPAPITPPRAAPDTPTATADTPVAPAPLSAPPPAPPAPPSPTPTPWATRECVVTVSVMRERGGLDVTACAVLAGALNTIVFAGAVSDPGAVFDPPGSGFACVEGTGREWQVSALAKLSDAVNEALLMYILRWDSRPPARELALAKAFSLACDDLVEVLPSCTPGNALRYSGFDDAFVPGACDTVPQPPPLPSPMPPRPPSAPRPPTPPLPSPPACGVSLVVTKVSGMLGPSDCTVALVVASGHAPDTTFRFECATRNEASLSSPGVGGGGQRSTLTLTADLATASDEAVYTSSFVQLAGDVAAGLGLTCDDALALTAWCSGGSPLTQRGCGSVGGGGAADGGTAGPVADPYELPYVS